MVDWFYVVYGVAVFSLGLNAMVLALYFGFRDFKRVVNDWFKLRFKIDRASLIRATFFNANKRTSTQFLHMNDKGLIEPEGTENATYKVNEARIVHDPDGIPNAYFIVGNATQVDVYAEGKKSQASAHLIDAAIKLAMTAGDFGPLHEFISFVRKWIPYLVMAMVVIAAVLAILLWVMFDMAGNISAAAGGVINV